MTNVEVKYAAPNTTLLVARIDDRKLAFNAQRTAARSVPENKELALQWFVRGNPGDEYTIQITRPAAAVFKHTATLDIHGKDAGVHWFTIT